MSPNYHYFLYQEYRTRLRIVNYHPKLLSTFVLNDKYHCIGLNATATSTFIPKNLYLRNDYKHQNYIVVWSTTSMARNTEHTLLKTPSQCNFDVCIGVAVHIYLQLNTANSILYIPAPQHVIFRLFKVQVPRFDTANVVAAAGTVE